MNLEETLEKIAELAREELHIVRKRAEEKTPARDHGHDYHEAQAAADRWITTPTRFVGSTMPSTSRAGGTKAAADE